MVLFVTTLHYFLCSFLCELCLVFSVAFVTGGSLGGSVEEESFAGGAAAGGDALAARWRRLHAHFDDFVQVSLYTDLYLSDVTNEDVV